MAGAPVANQAEAVSDASDIANFLLCAEPNLLYASAKFKFSIASSISPAVL